MSKKLLPHILILLLGLFFANVAHWKYAEDIATAKKNYQTEEHLISLEVAQKVENVFQVLYDNIRTIARLPGVRKVDRHAQNLQGDANLTIQEIYNNLANSVSMSEVYIVPESFNPEKLDPFTNALEIPIKMYDELIVGKTALSLEDQDHEDEEVEEIEIYEYRLLTQQIKWFRQYFPTENSFEGLRYPAISGKEVITCDNSRFDPENPNDADRSGFVYSVPFYDIDGKLKGTISAIILSHALKEVLPESYYALRNVEYNFTALNQIKTIQKNMNPWIQKTSADPGLIYSEFIPLNIIDGESQWGLWIGLPNDIFWMRPDVVAARHFLGLGYLFIWVLAGFLMLGIFLVQRNRQKIIEVNKDLERKVQERTKELSLQQEALREVVQGVSSAGGEIFFQNLMTSLTKAMGVKFAFIGKVIKDSQAVRTIVICNDGVIQENFVYALENTPCENVVDRSLCFYPSRVAEQFPKDKMLVDMDIESYSGIPLKDSYNRVIGLMSIMDNKPMLNKEIIVSLLKIFAVRAAHEIERLEAEKNLKEEKEKAVILSQKAMEATKAKSNFLANMSHEIRTPMNSILGFSELLQQTSLDDKQQKYLDAVMTSGKLLVGIINDILDISKIEAGKIHLEVVEYDLEKTIHELMKIIVTQAKDKIYETYIEIDDDVPQIVKGDVNRIKQIFVNLLSNAVKFTETGEIGVEIRLEKELSGQEILLHGIVKDSGIGIPKEKLDVIFESFSQVDESTTRKYGGTGLGLTITKAIVEAMDGKIYVESEEGKGSEFHFLFKVSKKDVSTAEEIDSKIRNEFAGKTVFIIDDNEISRKILKKICERGGLKVLGEADSARGALQQLDQLYSESKIVPQIIFCDVLMEGMNGVQLAEKIKSNLEFKNVKIIAATADERQESIENESSGIFDAFLMKPFIGSELILSVSKALGIIKEVKKKAEDVSLETKKIEAKVLVVDDSYSNQQLIKACFIQLGCEGHFVNNGQEAIDVLRQGTDQFDLCLMDIQMPIMGGVEATKIIRQEISKQLPIVALTAAVMKEDQENALAAGMTDFLVKPILMKQLKECVLKFSKK